MKFSKLLKKNKKKIAKDNLQIALILLGKSLTTIENWRKEISNASLGSPMPIPLPEYPTLEMDIKILIKNNEELKDTPFYERNLINILSNKTDKELYENRKVVSEFLNNYINFLKEQID